MSPPKVAHVATIDKSLHFLLLQQMLSLRRRGYDVVGISTPGEEVPALEAAGIRHIPVPMTRSVTPFADLASLIRLYRVMRREGFTIVHTHNPKPGLLAQLAARMAGVPVVVNTLHGLYFHDHMHPAWRRFHVGMEKIAGRCSDAVLSQNREDVATALKEGLYPANRIRYLGNGIDLSRFNPGTITADDRSRRQVELRIPPGAPVVGFVGRLAARRKGFLDFLAAGRELSSLDPEIRFLVVGDSDPGKPDSVTPDSAEEHGIADRCVFLGHRPNEELPVLYSLMNVLVLPSLFEGVPRAVMEAAAMKVPAVVTDVKGNREAVRDGYNGTLVPLGDVPALVSAISAILMNEDVARRMGENGRRLALREFDERLVFDRVAEEYAHLLGAAGLRPPPVRPSQALS